MDSLLNTIKGAKILVIGDIMLDHYIHGDAERISPEAPVPVIHIEKESYVPGGAANVALNIQSLGGKAILCGTFGSDEAGSILKTKLDNYNIDIIPACINPNTSTIVKTRVIARHQQLCRLDREEKPTHYALQPHLYPEIESYLNQVDAVIFSDYAKGVITGSLIETVKSFARKKELFLAIDPKPKRKLNFDGLDLMTPNRYESIAMSQIEIDPHQPFPQDEICRVIWEKYKVKQLVITMGPDGMILSHQGNFVKHVPTAAIEVYDVSGAGDTVIASLTLALCRQTPIETAAQFANIAAGIVVGKLGTATASPEEILAYHNR